MSVMGTLVLGMTLSHFSTLVYRKPNDGLAGVEAPVTRGADMVMSRLGWIVVEG